MPPQIFALAKTTLVASAANAQYHSVLFCIFVYSPPRRRIEQREVSPYIVYHILPLCTSAFWRFGNPACMIFILFNSFRFARITQIHSCASNVPKPIFYPRNVHPSFGTLYSFPVYILTFPFIFSLSFFSSPGTTILTREQQYCRFSLVIHTLYVRIYSRFPPHTTAKNPPRICTFSATSTGGFSHFGAITPRRLPCVRRSS